MPWSFEYAAHALLFMERVGLQVDWLLHPRPLDRMAYLLAVLEGDAKGLSHSGAAIWILDELEKDQLAKCGPDKRNKVTAVLGTIIGNMYTNRRLT
jgi:hypothetical protein